MKGSVTLITGGASGLGRATAEFLVKLRSFVVICDLPTSKGAEVAKALSTDNCLFVPTDVTVEEDVSNLFSQIVKKCGKLDNIVNCSGQFVAQKVYDPKTKTPHDLKLFRHILEVNTVGTFNVIRLAIPILCANETNEDGQRGVIINVSSVAAYDGQTGTIAYSTSKGAIASMTLTLARELAVHGIRVCAITPGLFKTPMVEYLNLKNKNSIQTGLMNSILFPKRMGRPSEFAQLVQAIIENPMLNGEVIRLDAGMRLPPGKL